eukprot:1639784-Pyramimonas_sp.AAC.1
MQKNGSWRLVGPPGGGRPEKQSPYTYPCSVLGHPEASANSGNTALTDLPVLLGCLTRNGRSGICE